MRDDGDKGLEVGREGGRKGRNPLPGRWMVGAEFSLWLLKDRDREERSRVVNGFRPGTTEVMDREGPGLRLLALV